MLQIREKCYNTSMKTTEAQAPKPEILLAEDDRTIRRALCKMLETNGYCVRAAANGREAVEEHRHRRPDLILLDVMMPVMNGHDACREIRRTDADTPVVFLSALGSESDEMRGLEAGADTYTAKTASDGVLLARIAAAIRRRRHECPNSDFPFAGWRVRPERCAMTDSDGNETLLEEREIALLRIFAQHPGEVHCRDFLCAKLWGAEFDGTENALTVAISRLRKKLGADAAAIESIRGIGYRYRNSPC